MVDPCDACLCPLDSEHCKECRFNEEIWLQRQEYVHTGGVMKYGDEERDEVCAADTQDGPGD